LNIERPRYVRGLCVGLALLRSLRSLDSRGRRLHIVLAGASEINVKGSRTGVSDPHEQFQLLTFYL